MDSTGQDVSRRAARRFVGCLKPYLGMVVGAALMGVGKFTLPLAFPLAFKYVIDVLLATPPRFDWTMHLIDGWCVALVRLVGASPTPAHKLAGLASAMLFLYALQSVASFYRNYWAGIAGNGLIFDLQCRLFTHLQSLPHAFFDSHPSGVIVSRVLNDVQQANELVGSVLIDVWMDGISLVLVAAALWLLNWHLALVALCIAPVWVTFLRFFAPRIKAVSHTIQQSLTELAGELQERVAGASTIKSFGREADEIARFQHQAERLRERNVAKVRLAARQEMLIQLLTRAAPVVVIWVGTLMIIDGGMTLGSMIAFFSYLGFLYMPLERFAQLSVTVSSSMAAIERMFAFLDLKSAISDHPLARPFAIRMGSVEFEDVSFRYGAGEATPVLHNLNLQVQGGRRIALVGRSGAGKSTMANLIPRFYDATHGRVLIDGRDVRHYTLQALRANIALVSQDALLFSASIRDNLRYAHPEATDEMLWRALTMANLRDFVAGLPAQLDAVIGERGIKVSGGQRQRLAIARALLKDAKIVIFDEATSAVDSESEQQIHAAMETLTCGRTVFLIAHRLRSAVTADLTVVMDNGRIVETGTHAELLRRGGIYAGLFHEQARGLGLDAGPGRQHDLQSASV